MKAYKQRFYPTLAQRRQLEVEFSARRYVWNWALGARSRAYKERGASLNAVALSRLLTDLKSSQPFLRAASATALTYTLRDLDDAYTRFFKGQNKFPKFKRFPVNSVTYQMDKRKGASVFVPGELLKLPKLGVCRVAWSYNEIPVFPTSATVSCKAGKWFISLQCDCKDPIHPKSTDETIGLDMGLSSLVATSKGEKVKHPRFLKASARKLKIAQRRLAKAHKGGSNRRKLKTRVARIHQRIADQRADFLHKLSTSIVSNHKAIALEDLSVKGMMSNSKLARSIGDGGWYELRRQITYKAAWYGRTVNVVPRFTRSTGVCPDCGEQVGKLPLSVRFWKCPQCNSEHDRDIAAARVIDSFNTGRSPGIYACGLINKPDGSGISRDSRDWDDAGTAQRASSQGCEQRVSLFQGARS